MKLSNKTLGIIAIIGAPFLFMEMASGKVSWLGTSAPGICDLIYMTGWLCSITVLMRQNAAGDNKFGNRLLQLNIIFLCVACVWNVWEVFDPANTTTLYKILDFFWPASNVLLLVTGIVIAIKGRLAGIARYAPLIAGCWLPFAFIFGALSGGKNEISFYVIGLYSVVAWFILAVTVYRSGNTYIEAQKLQPAFA